MNTEELVNLVVDSLENMQAIDISVLNVIEISTFTDVMIICTGKTNRQVKAIAFDLVSSAEAANSPPLGVEGERVAEWILVDLGDVVVHVMQPKTRDFYQLEKLWDPELVDNRTHDVGGSSMDRYSYRDVVA